MKLKVDNREPAPLKEWLKANVGVECLFENLPAGDFEFVTIDGVSKMLIERKEIADLCASLKDGRFDEQKQKLSATAAADPRPIVLLIEGSYQGHEKQTTIESVRLTTQFRDGFFVLHTKSAVGVESTGDLLRQLVDLFQRGKFNPITLEEQHRRFIASRSAHRAGGQLSRRQDWWQLALAQIDGVGPKAAEVITAKYPTVQSLLDAYRMCKSSVYSQQLLADVVGPSNRRLGPKISEKVYNTITGGATITDKSAKAPSRSNWRSQSAAKPKPQQPPTEECLFNDDGENE
jgi:ERCC4-type nuclease